MNSSPGEDLAQRLTEPVLGRVHLFPVRHFSPRAALMVQQLIQTLKPALILVEGPADFNPRINELGLEHELPIAIFTYFREPDAQQRHSAFYPLCSYSPEWCAIRAGLDMGAQVRFIDKPLAELERRDRAVNHYQEREYPPGRYIDALCERLGVEGLDELWDVLFELDDALTPQEYVRRAHHLCTKLRQMGDGAIESDLEREAYMHARILEALEAHPAGPALVVTGGYHSSALYERLLDPRKDEITAATSSVAAQERGVTLTPFTYERVDRMSGYPAGLHGPALYEHAWASMQRGEHPDLSALTQQVIAALRKQGVLLTTANLADIELMAQGLARLRGRVKPWRFDLLDGISAALIKEQTYPGYEHPHLHTAREVFCGQRRGKLSSEVELPPLVTQTHAMLEALGLSPTLAGQHITLRLDEPEALLKSQLLHKLRVLQIDGFKLIEEPDFLNMEGLEAVEERWMMRWSPSFEGSLIERASYGVDLDEAALALIHEQARAPDLDAPGASALVLEATRMGLRQALDPLLATLLAQLRQDADFLRLGVALRRLLYLYAFDDVLGGAHNVLVREALAVTWLRAARQLESLGQHQAHSEALLAAINAIMFTVKRCHHEDFIDEQSFDVMLGRVAEDAQQLPLVRGACLGALAAKLKRADIAVLEALRSFYEPEALGDFLLGLFSQAREIAQRDEQVLASIDALLMGCHDDEFLALLPGFRLAFTYYSPAEKYALLELLFPKTEAAQARSALYASVDDALKARGQQLNQQLIATLQRYAPGLISAAPTHTATARHDSPAPQVAPSLLAAQAARYPHELRLLRWRLVMGLGAQGFFGGELEGRWAEIEQHVSFLYDREYDRGRGARGDRRGGAQASTLSVPKWLDGVHTLFPKQVIERLERDAMERYGLEELVTRPELLARAEPNMTLLKAVLRTKHLMNPTVLAMARQLVRQVAEQLRQQLTREITSPFYGALARRTRSQIKIAKNFDAERTIKANLKHFDPRQKKLLISSPKFFSRVRRHVDQWQLILVVDQSGSMVSSVIHSAVTASIFWEVKALRTHLIAFDTEIVDLSEDCGDPVETLMQVQLGGGTDIGKALRYAGSLVHNPRQTIIALITDFYEGGSTSALLSVTKQLIDDGVILLGLAALDEQANPSYDRAMAKRMVDLGAEVAAMTPGELAAWVAQRVR